MHGPEKDRQSLTDKLESPEAAHIKTQGSADPEKGWFEGQSAGGAAKETPQRRVSDHGPTTFYHISSSSENMLNNDSDDGDRQEGLLKILLHLSLPNPLLCLLFGLYGFVVTILILPFGPVLRLLRGFPPVPGQVVRALSPLLRFQLRLIRSSHPLEFEPPSSSSRILCVIVLAPVVSSFVTVAAWVAGAFWIYAAILGEPNQRTGREKEMEGRAAARWVRGVWEKWLLLAVKK